MNFKLKDNRYHLPISIIAVIIVVGPLLQPGYILTFDMSWSPVLLGAFTQNNYWVFSSFLSLLSRVTSSEISQKMLIVFILAMMFYGMRRLLSRILPTTTMSMYLARFLFIVCPFTYTRLMAGQYLVLLGYALLPWFVSSLFSFLEKPSPKQALRLLAWTVAVGFVSIHAIGFMVVISLVAMVVYGRDVKHIALYARHLLGVGIGWIIVNLFWLIPYVSGKGQGAQVAGFGKSQLQAFATVGDGLPVPLNTLLLQGFWGDTQHRYILPSSTGVLFYSVSALLAVLIGTGFWTSRREKATQILAISGFLAWIFAMGIAWGPVSGLNTFLFQHVPLWRGYREPEKWLAVLALAYAVFAARGLGELMQRFPKWKLALMSALVLPILWTPMMLWGAGGQLVSQDYPMDWYAFNKQLAAEHSDGKLLALPWHQYVTLSFANNRDVANPAPGFFDSRTVISSSNPELKGVAPIRDSDQSYVDDIVLPQRLYRTDAGSELAKINVEYVLVMKEADWRSYGWLDKQTDLKLIRDTGDLKVYKNTALKH